MQSDMNVFTDTCHKSPTKIQTRGGRHNKGHCLHSNLVIVCSILSILEFPYIPYYVISGSYTVVCIIYSRLLTVFQMAEKKIEPRRKKYYCINEE